MNSSPLYSFISSVSDAIYGILILDFTSGFQFDWKLVEHQCKEDPPQFQAALWRCHRISSVIFIVTRCPKQIECGQSCKTKAFPEQLDELINSETVGGLQNPSDVSTAAMKGMKTPRGTKMSRRIRASAGQRENPCVVLSGTESLECEIFTSEETR